MLGLSVGLVAGSVAGVVALVAGAHDREPVLVLNRDIAWSERISRADLTTVELPPDAARFTVSRARLGEVAGKVAATNLRAGELLTPRDLTTQVVPGPGQVVVGLRLEPGRYPSARLDPNTPVEVTALSPSSSPTVEAGPAASGFRARVVRMAPPDAEGAVVVDLLLPDYAAHQATSAAATGAVVTVLGPDH
ncbi:SAF domain-containing protein [Saccharopolyspora sp. ID03-671]|uniref:SAF domain-containing protein n=1 Tax=Saccharopolyspora sp. ID03-671 TaxID=3073066 RepID=UPI00324802D9